MTEEEKVDQIMGDIREVKTLLKEVVKPAISQVYENERAILTLNNDAKHTKDSRSRLISYAALVLSAVVTILSFLRLYKPPHIPH